MRVGSRITPASKFLSTPPSISGVDFKLMIAIICGALMFSILLKSIYVPIFAYVIVFILKQINKDDPMMMKVIQAYTRQGSFYIPFSKFKKRRHDRPNGFGRGNI